MSIPETFTLVIKTPIALRQYRKVMAMQVHWVCGGDEKPFLVAAAGGWNLVGSGDDHPDPFVLGMFLGSVIVCDDIQVGLVDEFVFPFQGKHGGIGEIDTEGGIMHHPAIL